MIVPSHVVPLAAPGMIWTGIKMMFDSESPFFVRLKPDAELLSWLWRFSRAATPAHVERSAPLLKKLHLRSRAIFIEWHERLGGRFRLKTDGLLVICKEKATLDREAHESELAARLGIPINVLPADELKRLEPDMEMDVAGAVYYPMDCCLDPTLLMRTLEEECLGLGVEIDRGVEIDAIEASGGTISRIRSRDREYLADEFVLSGGVWSSALTSKLGLRMPMTAGKGYSLTVTKPRELPKHCAILSEARVAVTPFDTALRFGGTMEIGSGEGISPNRIRGIIRSVPRYFPRWQESDFEGLNPWFGMRPCSPDGLPYLGRPQSLSNLIVATGHAMMGISLAPITGEICASFLCGETPSIDARLLSPDRYR